MSRGKRAFCTYCSPIVNSGSMAGAFLRRASTSLLAMRRDGDRRLLRREVAIWTGETGAGWSFGTRDSAIPDTLASVADPVELFDGMIDVNGFKWINNDRRNMGICVLSE